MSAWLDSIICGDNVAVLSGFPDACIDLVVTSPPYDDLRTYGGHSWNFEVLAAQLTRVLKPGGVIVWVVADRTADGSETGTSMRQALHFKDACGLRLHDTMIWHKYLPGLYGKRYTFAWEYMFVLAKGEPNRWNPIMRRNVTGGKRGGGRRGADGSRHPAAFPDDLARKHIILWSNPGDTVLDPFVGSGTTCKAAKELNRHWCGIDINPDYCRIAESRLHQGVLQLESAPKSNL